MAAYETFPSSSVLNYELNPEKSLSVGGALREKYVISSLKWSILSYVAGLSCPPLFFTFTHRLFRRAFPSYKHVPLRHFSTSTRVLNISHAHLLVWVSHEKEDFLVCLQ